MNSLFHRAVDLVSDIVLSYHCRLVAEIPKLREPNSEQGNNRYFASEFRKSP
jgi:hypothetical protein